MRFVISSEGGRDINYWVNTSEPEIAQQYISEYRLVNDGQREYKLPESYLKNRDSYYTKKLVQGVLDFKNSKMSQPTGGLPTFYLDP